MKKINIEEVLENTYDLSKKKVGYVSIIGRPNAGKSTFINAVIWKQIAITSNIPQTTRNKILAVYTTDTSQIIFLDTPWIHESKKAFNQFINSQALSSINEADMILYFIDSTRKSGDEEKYIQDLLSKVEKPVLQVYTKTDIQISDVVWDDIFHISSINKSGFNELIEKIESYLPKDNMLFPEDIYTQQDLFFRCSEIIRGNAFDYIKEELPHSIYVEVADIEHEEKMYKINAYLYAESDSQKYILIGKNGELIKKIATSSRKDLEIILEKKVFLTLRVKVRKNWRKDIDFVKRQFKK